MLRVYFLQHWFNLSDPAVEEAPYDSLAMRAFAGVDLGEKPTPDETTICKFRHLLERKNLSTRLFQEVGRYLQERGMKVSSGTIVDATTINAPSGTVLATSPADCWHGAECNSAKTRCDGNLRSHRAVTPSGVKRCFLRFDKG